MVEMRHRPSILRRMVRPRWVDLGARIMSPGQDSLEPGQARDWALVLAAARLPHRVVRLGRTSRVLVQAWSLGQAREEVEAWLLENEGQAAVKPAEVPGTRARVWPTALAMLAMLLFHFFVQGNYPDLALYSHDFYDAGSALALAIHQGEWWRLGTALFLHADGGHVMANALIGGAFIVLAAQRLGTGTAWLLVLVSGVLGNLINAQVVSSGHDSVGFSTAVFGAAGILAGLRVGQRQVKSLGGLLIPLAAGLGILAMLGAGGENTDLGAHLFGLAAGVGIGWAAGEAVRAWGLPGRWWDVACGVGAAAFMVLCWWLALSG